MINPINRATRKLWCVQIRYEDDDGEHYLEVLGSATDLLAARDAATRWYEASRFGACPAEIESIRAIGDRHF